MIFLVGRKPSKATFLLDSTLGALLSVKPTLKGVSGLLVVWHERYNTKKGMKAIEKGSSR